MSTTEKMSENLEKYGERLEEIRSDWTRSDEAKRQDLQTAYTEARTTHARLEDEYRKGLNAWCEFWDHHPNKSAKARRGRPSCSLSQMQKLCNATLAARRARKPSSS